DALRRAMGSWRRTGGLGDHERRLVDGMTRNGYPAEFAQRVVEQIKGFSSYGFPESHAVSFALLVYDSAWIKRHDPAEFLAALLNSQPLGFYTPGQLVQDARRHGVEGRPADVVHSGWDCTLEPRTDSDAPAVRLGLRLADGVTKTEALRIMDARRLGVEVRHADVVHSGWDCTLAPRSDSDAPPVRLGLRLAAGVTKTEASRIMDARGGGGPFSDA